MNSSTIWSINKIAIKNKRNDLRKTGKLNFLSLKLLARLAMSDNIAISVTFMFSETIL
jgi:hypothetical protein